ncbi:MAG: hypothetical protein B7Z39_02635 [Novosphingobium sp. 12-64-8]|nr:MAG: hypothetical protein B7Z39_02635 [Novosphingobium sp. 12-64-8]
MEARPAIEGGCACGAVRYRALDAGFLPYACHCQGCQRRQGSAFALNQQVLAADFSCTGATTQGRVTSVSGAQVTHTACAACLTRVYTANDRRPDLVTIRTGTRDDSPQMSPAFHIWTSSMQPWIDLPGHVPAFTGQPDEAEWLHLVRPAGEVEGLAAEPR